MPEFKHKHYVRLNENSEVVHGFSDAFEQANDGDILLCETVERHFGIDQSMPENFLPLHDAQMRPRWKWNGSKIVDND